MVPRASPLRRRAAGRGAHPPQTASSPDAEAALDSILATLDGPPPEGTPAAVQLAAQAEALALKGRWEDADQRYRRAIEEMPDDAIRRSWWINVAEIALHRNDVANRQKALEAAKGKDQNEEIASRAVELLKSSGRRTESDRVGLK